MVYSHYMDMYGYVPPQPEPGRATPERAIFYDMIKGNTSYITHLLDSHDNLSPNIRNAGGETPLLFAVRYAPKEEKLNIVRLLGKRLDVMMSIPDDHGRTALHEAVLQDDPAVVRELLQWHADAFAKDKDGKTPLDLIAGADCPKLKADLLKNPPAFLLQQGKKDVYNALRTAAHHVACTDEKPPAPTTQEKLMREFTGALTKYDLRGVKRVLDNQDFDIHGEDDLPLRQAAFFGYADIVDTLLEYGADPRVRNNEPLYHAVRQERTFTIKNLLACGADPEEHMRTFRSWKFRDDLVPKMLEDFCLQNRCADSYDQGKYFSRNVKPRWGEKRRFKKTADAAIKKGDKQRLKDIFFEACKLNRPWTVHNILKKGDIENDELLQQGIKHATQYNEKERRDYRNKDIVHVLLEHGADPQKAANGFYDKLFTDRMIFKKQSEYRDTLAIMSLMEQFGASRKKAEDKYFKRDSGAEDAKKATDEKAAAPVVKKADKPEIKIDINPFRPKPPQ
jgi:ankyrin repeat protein